MNEQNNTNGNDAASIKQHQLVIEQSQLREERISKRSLYVSIFAVFLLAGVLFLFIYNMRNANKTLANTIKEFTWVQQEFKEKDLGVQAQKEAFRKFGMKVFTVNGKAYDSKHPIAFSKRQKVEVLELSYDISHDLNKLGSDTTKWDAITTGIGEAALNPFENGANGEKGYLQFKWKTAVTAYGHYMLMPSWFRKKYPIELKKNEDLYNPYVSTVLFYCYYGDLLKEYRGSEQWAMSEYHWGLTFLGNSYQKGQGDLPVSFEIEGKVYFVTDYWMNWYALRECIASGQLEVGKSYARDIRREKKRMLREEIQLNSSKNIIKGLRNQVRELKELSSRLEKGLAKYGKSEEKAYKDFSRIYKIIEAGDFKNIKIEMNKHKKIVKAWHKRYEEKNKRDRRIMQISAIIIAAAITVLIFCILMWAVRWRVHKYKIWKQKRS